MDIGLAIKTVRKLQSVKQCDLAKEIGVSQSFLSLIESNKKNPSIGTLDKISAFFEIPIPIILWYGLDVYGIPFIKQHVYYCIKPAIDELFQAIFEIDQSKVK